MIQMFHEHGDYDGSAFSFAFHLNIIEVQLLNLVNEVR